MFLYAMKDKKTNAFGLVTLCNSDSEAIKYYDNIYCQLIPEISDDDEDLIKVVKSFDFDLMCLGTINLSNGELISKIHYVSSFNYDSIMTSYNMRGENDVVSKPV